MLKKYLHSCNSKEFFNSRKVPQKSIYESREQTQFETVICESQNRTIQNPSMILRQNIKTKRDSNRNYYTGIRPKQFSQHAVQPVIPQLKIHSTDKKTIIYDGQDLEETQKQENKMRSISYSSRKQVHSYQRQSSNEGRSVEKIKVFDIFNQTPRQKITFSHQAIQQQLSGFKEKIVYSSQSKQQIVQKQILQAQLSEGQKKMHCQQVAYSSRLNDSQDILQKLQRNSTQEKSADRVKPAAKSFFKMNSNQMKDLKSNIQKQPLKIEVDRFKNDNILELLLLTTGELKEKFREPLVRNNSEEQRQLRSGVNVRATNRFPKDFF